MTHTPRSPWDVMMGHSAVTPMLGSGAEVWQDLSKAPHVLACGTSGSGKSVGIHALLYGLVTSGTPSDTRIVIADVKRVEFGMWRQAPHVDSVVTDKGAILQALQAEVAEMDRRYALMERLGVQDVSELRGTRRAMPRRFFVADEIADLTMTSRDRQENVRVALTLGALTRIAQLGRAAGVHLVVATQRPAADTLPGNLRANLGTRWAFRVRTGAESRIALDARGAEALGAAAGTSLVSWRGAPATFVQGRYVSRSDVLQAVSEAQARYGRSGVGWSLGRLGDVPRAAYVAAAVATGGAVYGLGLWGVQLSGR